MELLLLSRRRFLEISGPGEEGCTDVWSGVVPKEGVDIVVGVTAVALAAFGRREVLSSDQGELGAGSARCGGAIIPPNAEVLGLVRPWSFPRFCSKPIGLVASKVPEGSLGGGQGLGGDETSSNPLMLSSRNLMFSACSSSLSLSSSCLVRPCMMLIALEIPAWPSCIPAVRWTTCSLPCVW